MKLVLVKLAPEKFVPVNFANSKLALERLAFLNDAYYALRALGNNRLSNDRKEILDAFLRKRRWFDTNVVSTFNQADDIKDLNNQNKTSYINALNKVDFPAFVYPTNDTRNSDCLL